MNLDEFNFVRLRGTRFLEVTDVKIINIHWSDKEAFINFIKDIKNKYLFKLELLNFDLENPSEIKENRLKIAERYFVYDKDTNIWFIYVDILMEKEYWEFFNKVVKKPKCFNPTFY